MILSAFFCLSHTHGSIPLKALAPCYIFRLKLKVQILQKKNVSFIFVVQQSYIEEEPVPTIEDKTVHLFFFAHLDRKGESWGGEAPQKSVLEEKPICKTPLIHVYMYLTV